MTVMTYPITPDEGASAPAAVSWQQRLADRTPADRDRYADLLRVGALTVVVLGHWTLVLVVLDGTDAFAGNLAAEVSTWVLMVMPVFFLVGGFAHATALLGGGSGRGLGVTAGGYVDFVRARAARLLQPVLVYLAVWLVLSIPVAALGLDTGAVATALDRAPTPLWFIAVYLVIVLLAPLMLAAHERAGGWVFVVLVAAVAALDVARFVGDAGWTAPFSLLLVWLLVHQLGFLWADGTLARRGAAVVVTVAGFGTALLLTVVTGWYPLDMLGLPGSQTSNFAPPTVALLAHAVGFAGVLLLVRAAVTRWLRRPRVWAPVVVVGSLALTIYCWHLSAAFVVQGLFLLAGIGWPAAPSAAWWLLLPVWWALNVPVLALLVVVARHWERPRPFLAAPVPAGRLAVWTTTGGSVLAAAGILVVSQVGLDGILSGDLAGVYGIPLATWQGLLMLLFGVVLIGRPPAGATTTTTAKA